MSDGTPYGTVRVGDVAPGAANSNPTAAQVSGNLLYFDADDNTGLGKELWAIPLDQLPVPDPMAGDILRRLLGKPCDAEPFDQTGEGELDIADFFHIIYN